MIQVHKIIKGVYLFESAEGMTKVICNKNKLWMSEKEMAKLFHTDTQEIHQMISKIFLEGEFGIYDNIISSYNSIANKQIKYYSLDIILSIGYRLKCFEETKFVITGNRILKQYQNHKKSPLDIFQNGVKNFSKIFKSLQIKNG